MIVCAPPGELRVLSGDEPGGGSENLYYEIKIDQERGATVSILTSEPSER